MEILVYSFVKSMLNLDLAMHSLIESGVSSEELLSVLERTAAAGSVTAGHLLNSVEDGLCLCCLESIEQASTYGSGLDI